MVKLDYYRFGFVSFGEYRLLVDKFAIKAQNKKITGDIADLAKKLGSGKSAEND